MSSYIKSLTQYERLLLVGLTDLRSIDIVEVVSQHQFFFCSFFEAGIVKQLKMILE
jgi:hypothetical protein